ncbi:MAG: hypothetical protein JST16_04005 [Bdellovibrionales bacterium]|nr:hypothetical protein [Bdellovibrionales bacterium]
MNSGFLRVLIFVGCVLLAMGAVVQWRSRAKKVDSVDSTPVTETSSSEQKKFQLRLPTITRETPIVVNSAPNPAVVSQATLDSAEPVFASPGKYKGTKVAIVWDASCRGHLLAKQNELTHLVFSRTGLSGEKQFPRNAHVQEITQFWQQDHSYYQMSATWTSSVPAAYRIEFFVSSDPNFSRDIRRLPIPDLRRPASVGVEIALRTINKTLQEAKAQGAQEGARRELLSVASPQSNGEPKYIRYLNAQPVEYREAGLHCVGSVGSSSTCRCGQKGGA